MDKISNCSLNSYVYTTRLVALSDLIRNTQIFLAFVKFLLAFISLCCGEWLMQNTHKWSKCREWSVKCAVLSWKGDLWPSPHDSSTIVEEKAKSHKSRRWGRDRRKQYLLDMTFTHSQQLWLPAQNLHKSKPVNSWAWMREGLTGHILGWVAI